MIASHVMASCYIYIGKREYNKGQRFDDRDMFNNLNDRNFVTLPKPDEMSPFELYI